MVRSPALASRWSPLVEAMRCLRISAWAAGAQSE